jgi:hypothetical protein
VETGDGCEGIADYLESILDLLDQVETDMATAVVSSQADVVCGCLLVRELDYTW